MFNPTEIIFSVTTACNLHCPHCFVNKNPQKLSIEKSITFIQNCLDSHKTDKTLPKIEKIGFTGGEPFLYTSFIEEIVRFSVKNDMMFDQIMTNGDWWKTEEELNTTLKKIYDAGYDGKIGVSWDSFHGQDSNRIVTFVTAVQKIFGQTSVNIQTVDRTEEGESLPLSPNHASLTNAQENLPIRSLLSLSATPSNGVPPRNAPDFSLLPKEIQVYHLPQTFQSNDKRAWNSKHWFKDDYCEGPGNILFVHPDGNIAPCCGFANENQELFIGTINDSLKQIMQNAKNNKMVEICFNKGLSKYRKELKRQLKKEGTKYLGKCCDICSFCDFVCKKMR